MKKWAERGLDLYTIAALMLFFVACATFTPSLSPVPRNVHIIPAKPLHPRAQDVVFNFKATYYGRECPDKILWIWGMGESAELQTQDEDGGPLECPRSMKRPHVFETTAPRKVWVAFLKGDDLVGSDSFDVHP